MLTDSGNDGVQEQNKKAFRMSAFVFHNISTKITEGCCSTVKYWDTAEKKKLYPLYQDRMEEREMGGGLIEIRELSGFLPLASQIETQTGVKAPVREGLLGGTRLMDSDGPSRSQEKAMNLEEPHWQDWQSTWTDNQRPEDSLIAADTDKSSTSCRPPSCWRKQQAWWQAKNWID